MALPPAIEGGPLLSGQDPLRPGPTTRPPRNDRVASALSGPATDWSSCLNQEAGRGERLPRMETGKGAAKADAKPGDVRQATGLVEEQGG